MFFKMNSDKKLLLTTAVLCGLEAFRGRGGLGGFLGRITANANFPYHEQRVFTRVLGISDCDRDLYTIVFM